MFRGGYVSIDCKGYILKEDTIGPGQDDPKIICQEKGLFNRVYKAIQAGKSIYLQNLIFDSINNIKTNIFLSDGYILNYNWLGEGPYKWENVDTIFIYKYETFYYNSSNNEDTSSEIKFIINANDKIGCFA